MRNISTNKYLKIANSTKVYSLIRERKELSKSQLSLQSGLSFSAVSKICNSLVDEGMLREADIAGVLTGNKDDKSVIMLWHPGTSGAPIPDKAPVVMECEVYQNVETEGFDNFILDIKATWVQDDLLTDGKIDSSKVGAVLFDGPTYSYVRTGETICPCTSLAKRS